MKGRLELMGPWSDDEGQRAWVAELASSAAPKACKTQRNGQTIYLKASALARGPALRHALRKLILRRPTPRMAEFENLAWLRGHGFDCPRPLLAATHQLAGVSVFQLLATEWLDDHLNLEQYSRQFGRRFAQHSGRDAVPLMEQLGQQVGRMHKLGFVHRDLFTRNILVPAAGDPRVQFIDAWRGGARLQSRAPAYDLGCLFLDTTQWFTPDEQSSFVQAYRRERGARFAATRSRAWQRLLQKAERERGRLHAKLEAKSQ